jgi:peptide/nickel transport system permease protein
LGIRSTLIIGIIAGVTSIVIGALIGLISGYYGGWIDNLLMRFTDVAYGMPFIPLIMVLVAILGRDIWIIAISLICIVWRSSARVVRAEVLSIREQQFVLFAKARGCSDSRIILTHILPNLLPLLLLYTAINVVWSILSEAAISFLGFGDPDILTLGSMLYELWVSGVFRSAWWWFLPPSLSIVLLISAMIFISQAYEEVTNPKLRER